MAQAPGDSSMVQGLGFLVYSHRGLGHADGAAFEP